MSFTNQLKKATLRTAFGYLEKNPEENALKLMSWVDKWAMAQTVSQRAQLVSDGRPAEQHVSARYEHPEGDGFAGF